MQGETTLKRIVRFFKKAFNFFKMYNIKLRQQAAQFEQFKEKGKVILQQVLDEFNKLDASPDAVCKLVDNDTKLLIKFLGVWALIGIDKLQDNYGSLIVYKANRWSSDWEDYTIPINADIQFDKLGNIFVQGKPIDGVEPEAYRILEYVMKVGKIVTN